MTGEEKQRPFDAISTLERWGEYWRNHPHYRNRGKRLDFRQRCAVYAMLYAEDSIPQAVVCKVFNISRATVSYIAGCRDDNRNSVIVEQDSGLLDDNGLPVVYRETIGADGHLTKNRSADRRFRYQDIVDEFERLGAETFVRKYYTQEIHLKMRQVWKEMTGKIYLDGVKKTVDRDEG